MVWTKYLKLSKYLGYINRKTINLKIRLKKPLIINTPFRNENIRFSYAASEEDLKRAMELVEETLKELK
mgnify:CR=1 FL=1